MSVYSITNGDLTYYGSTKQPICQRKSEHKYAYKNRKGWYRSGLVFENAEKTNTKVVVSVVEEVNGTIAELRERERWYIANNKCVNKKAMSLKERKQRQHQRYLDTKIKSPDTI